MSLRSPIIAVLGHVDHGKSSILDRIRGSNIVAGEAGAITQAIGASIIPTATIKEKIGSLIDTMKMELKIPGLLFIDTPGHAAFTSLRNRGGNLADIAILVVDINEGFKPQTHEAVEILKKAKTPFIIAANKLDILGGSSLPSKGMLLPILGALGERTATAIDTKLYEIVGTLHEKHGVQAERFDRVEDYTRSVAIVPCSAKTGLGLQELLMVLAGLAQKYLEHHLEMEASGPGRGIILEMKEEKGLGKTIDVILYDGTVKVGDTIVYGTLHEPKSTKIRALLEPEPNTEMRDKKGKFRSVKQASAAIGIKVSAPDLEGAVAGMPVWVADSEDIERLKEEMLQEKEDVQISTETEGVIIKADTIGSLEAMIHMLKDRKIPIRSASIGPISKKDINDAETNIEKNPLYACILGFSIPHVASTPKVKIVVKDVIYSLIDEFDEWQQEQKKREEAKHIGGLTKPVKIEVLQNCTFRISNPCIVGVEILSGTLRTGMPLMNEEGVGLTLVKQIQADKESVTEAEKGRQVAISLPHVTAGKQFEEMSFLYSDIPEEDFRTLKQYVEHLSGDEKTVLKRIAEIKRKHNPVWGV